MRCGSASVETKAGAIMSPPEPLPHHAAHCLHLSCWPSGQPVRATGLRGFSCVCSLARLRAGGVDRQGRPLMSQGARNRALSGFYRPFSRPEMTLEHRLKHIAVIVAKGCVSLRHQYDPVCAGFHAGRAHHPVSSSNIGSGTRDEACLRATAMGGASTRVDGVWPVRDPERIEKYRENKQCL